MCALGLKARSSEGVRDNGKVVMRRSVYRNEEKGRVGILSTNHAPLLWYQISLLSFLRSDEIIIIMDNIKETDFEKELWIQRTGGMFEEISTPVIRACRNWLDKITVVQVDNHNNDETVKLIGDNKISLLLSAGSPRKLKKSILNSAPQGVINVHPGILPGYRGCNCVEWALFNTDPVGNSVYFMDEGYDSGPIIETKELTNIEGLSYQQIRVRIHEESCRLAADSIKMLLETGKGVADFPPQDEEKAIYWKVMPEPQLGSVVSRFGVVSADAT